MLPLVLVLAAALALVAAGDIFEFRSVRTDGPDVDAPPVITRREREPRPSTRNARSWRAPSVALFAACSLLYLAVAAYVVLHRGGIIGDAAARVAQAWYVVGSRDPHLAAIGFVWNPLPSIAAIPLVMLRGFWPALTVKMFAGNIVSALAMAGAVVQVRGLLRDLDAPRGMAVALTACFALNPMVITYGANGMSEAMYLLFLIGTTRYLVQWTVSGRLRPLVLTAINLALAFLTRYEALAAAVGVIAVVLFVGVIARDRAGTRRERFAAAGADALIVGIPVVTSFLAWVVVSWVITGEPLQQFSSRYGNASILAASGGSAGSNGTGWPKIVLALAQTISYAPLVVPLTIVVLVVAILRRDRRFLALVALAGPIAFSIFAYSTGSTFGFMRYYIPVVPMVLIATALLLCPREAMRPAAPRWLRAAAPLALVVALVVGVTGIAGTAFAMNDTRLGPDERAFHGWLFGPARSASEIQQSTVLSSGHEIAAKIDALGLSDSAVAIDTFNCGSLVVLASAHPHQFVITSDRDFERVVADPVAFSVPYFLVPESGQGIEAISLVHQGIYGGGRVGNLTTKVVAEYQTTGCPTYRLIRVVSDGN